MKLGDITSDSYNTMIVFAYDNERVYPYRFIVPRSIAGHGQIWFGLLEEYDWYA